MQEWRTNQFACELFRSTQRLHISPPFQIPWACWRVFLKNCITQIAHIKTDVPIFSQMCSCDRLCCREQSWTSSKLLMETTWKFYTILLYVTTTSLDVLAHPNSVSKFFFIWWERILLCWKLIVLACTVSNLKKIKEVLESKKEDQDGLDSSVHDVDFAVLHCNIGIASLQASISHRCCSLFCSPQIIQTFLLCTDVLLWNLFVHICTSIRLRRRSIWAYACSYKKYIGVYK